MALTRFAEVKANNFYQGTYPNIHTLSYLLHSLIHLDSVPVFFNYSGMFQLHDYLDNDIVLTSPMSHAILREGQLSIISSIFYVLIQNDVAVPGDDPSRPGTWKEERQ